MSGATTQDHMIYIKLLSKNLTSRFWYQHWLFSLTRKTSAAIFVLTVTWPPICSSKCQKTTTLELWPALDEKFKVQFAGWAWSKLHQMCYHGYYARCKWLHQATSSAISAECLLMRSRFSHMTHVVVLAAELRRRWYKISLKM